MATRRIRTSAPLPIELKETEDKLIINGEAPGFTPEEIEVSVEPHCVIITGKAEHSTKKKEAKTVFTELRSNETFRDFNLPVTVVPERSKAVLKNGMLELTLTKEKESKPVAVEVKE